MKPISLNSAAADPFIAIGPRPALPLPPARLDRDPIGQSVPPLSQKRAAAIEGPRPVDIQPGPPKDIWMFVVDRPPTGGLTPGLSVPESSDAWGGKPSREPVADPPLPDVRPTERLVDSNTIEAPTVAPQTVGHGTDVVRARSNADVSGHLVILARRAYQATSESIVTSRQWLSTARAIER